MARIKDKKKIPIKDVPNVEDYLVGSDSEDGGKTANFKIGAIRGGSSMTDAAVKIAYENNLNTNEFSDAEKSKLDGLGDDTSIYDSDGTIGAGVTRNVTVDGTLAIKNGSSQGINFSQAQFSLFHPDIAFLGSDSYLALKNGIPAALGGSYGVRLEIGEAGTEVPPTVGQVLAAKDVDGGLEWVDVQSTNDRVVEPDLTGLATYAIDYSLGETFFLAITQATSLTELNLPSAGESKVITIHVSGNFALTYPAGWDTNITGAYTAGTGLTTITVEYVATAVPFYKVLIVQ